MNDNVQCTTAKRRSSRVLLHARDNPEDNDSYLILKYNRRMSREYEKKDEETLHREIMIVFRAIVFLQF